MLPNRLPPFATIRLSLLAAFGFVLPGLVQGATYGETTPQGEIPQSEIKETRSQANAVPPKGKPKSRLGKDEPKCGRLNNSIGPFDYRIASSGKGREGKLLRSIQARHWSESVKSFKKKGYQHDINYVLRVFPNHHPVLYATARRALKKKRAKGTLPLMYTGNNQYWPMTFECYIDRAVRFIPDDGVTWMIWGVYLHKSKQYKQAIAKYQRALDEGVESSELQFNIGLAYFKVNNLQKASEHAKIAYKMGYPLPGLKRKLQKLGAW